MSDAAVVSTESGGIRSALGDATPYAPRVDVERLGGLILEFPLDADAAQANATQAHERISAYARGDEATRFSALLDQARA